MLAGARLEGGACGGLRLECDHMRTHTLPGRGRFYRRRRSHWKLNVALVSISVALAGFVVFDVSRLAGAPAARPPNDAAVRPAASALTKRTPVRTAPTERGAPRTTLASGAAAPVLAAAPPMPRALTPQQACDLIRARTRRVGEEVRFRGEFVNARPGVATIRPVGCEERASVAVIPTSALRHLDEADRARGFSAGRRLIAEFTARLVRGGLSVSTVRDVKVIEPAPLPRSLARIVMRSATPTAGCKACSVEVPF